jgi:hypothetical protein
LRKIIIKLIKIWHFELDIPFVINKLSGRYKTLNYLQESVTIGITTFLDRFDYPFRPLLEKLTILFPSVKIIVIANGHYKAEEQVEYIKKLKQHCALYQNVTLAEFHKPVSLSKMWNTIIHKSDTPKVLIINDDLKFASGFLRDFETALNLPAQLTTINQSWSHFLIAKDLIDKNGWFDERLAEFGGEDDDYAARMASKEMSIANLSSTNITSAKIRTKPKINSFGKVVKNQKFGYSNANYAFLLRQKWIARNKPFPGAIFVPNREPKYWKLRKGQLTTDFYPNLQPNRTKPSKNKII